MNKYCQLILFLVVIENSNQKLKFQPWLAYTRPFKSQTGPKWGENMIFNGWERYYIVSMNKYYKLPLFLFLFGMFDRKSTFSLNWHELGFIRVKNKEQTQEKRGFQVPKVVLHNFYVQLLQIYLVSFLN